ncbi:hypothetical protein DID80_01340 [Candidatus Marinamargulisbacteria bacterium SCGC AAA071-K20]|nr:hypothetical protein DID80_01340 [Candidatus Marinamargulisbacteria bacterium SCGC AAA071-K20]
MGKSALLWAAFEASLADLDFVPSLFIDDEFFHLKYHRASHYCQVPFKPNGEKPVYCNECYRKGDTNFSNQPKELN